MSVATVIDLVDRADLLALYAFVGRAADAQITSLAAEIRAGARLDEPVAS